MEEYINNNPFEQLTKIIYNLLFDEITSFKLKPGSKINIAEIANDLNVSRTPIVEAIKILENINLAEKHENKSGWYVVQLSQSEAIELCTARSAIEVKASFLCAERSHCPHIEKMEQLAVEYRDAFDNGFSCEVAEKLDIPFHHLILEDCGNRFLKEYYESISRKLVRYQLYAKRMIVSDPREGLREKIKTQHISIVNAIKLNMPEIAQQAMENHMNTCFSFIMRIVENR